MNIIELKKINKYFGSGGNRVHVLKNIDLQIEKGDFVAIIGQSGSGKSTMMNIIGCLDVPTAGSYKINGVEVGRMDKDQLAELRCKTFGFIFQRYNLLNSLKASENAALPAVYLGLNAEARDRRAVELLKKLDLGNKLANRPNELSGGQQRRRNYSGRRADRRARFQKRRNGNGYHQRAAQTGAYDHFGDA